ncbi:MAG: PAS domain S-box protein [Desulfobulbaceae bacterium]|nr:PAS domain S-box protein [Desulfobulbaceae bacterium]
MKRFDFQQAVLVLVTAVVLAGLFCLPYWSVRKKTITAFNNEQMIVVNQAINGIQSFFDTYAKALHYFAGQSAIIDLDDSGRLLMENFHSIHSSELAAITRIDASGQILYTAPQYNEIIGKDVSDQLHNRLIVEKHKPVVSEVFITEQGYDSVAFAYPVFRGREYAGCITFFIPFAVIASQHLQSINIDEDGFVLLISKNGVGLYCPNGGHVGSTITQCFSDKTEMLAMAEKMMAHEQGSAVFTVPESVDNGGSTGSDLVRFAVFAPINLPGDNYWAIAVAAPANKVLSAMDSFRDQWLLVTSTAICTVLLLSFFLTRSLAQSREEKKRRTVEKQMVRLLDFTPMGIVVFGADGIISYVNQAVVDLIEESGAEKIIGGTILELVHTDFKEFIAERFQNLLSGKPNDIATIKVLTAKGMVKEVEINSTLFVFNEQTSFISILRDVTAERKAEEVQRRLVTAIEQVRESVVITNAREGIEYVNPAFSDITGYSREEALGKTLRVLRSGQHDPEFYQAMWETITEGNVWNGRIINRRKDGSLFTELATISPVRDVMGKITHFVAVKRDITHEVHLESQLRQVQKMEALGTLAGGIAHDFNNILGAILGFTDMAILQSNPDSPMYENLTHIRKGGRRAADLVQQILTFSRQSTAEKVPVSVVPLVKESLKLLRASLPSTIDIRQEFKTLDAQVLADPVQIQQIIMNLCTNSFHAMRDQGGRLFVRLQLMPSDQFGLSLALKFGQCLELIVKDTGAGIDEETLGRIFDPFFTTKSPGEGTGMGLSVVHGIVQDLGGDISVQSTPGEGTEFRVLLPVAKLGQAEKDVNGEKSLPAGTEHVLVVDDEEDIRDTSRMMLSHLGYQVTLCGDPGEALSLVREQGERFDLVITDQTMPEMTGTRLVKELTAIRPDLPVMLCTGYSDKLNEVVALEAGARKLLMKPVDLHDFAVSIRSVLDGESSSEQLTAGSATAHSPRF